MEILKSKRKVYSQSKYMLVMDNFGGGIEDTVYRIIEATNDFKMESRFDLSKPATYKTIEEVECSACQDTNLRRYSKILELYYNLI